MREYASQSTSVHLAGGDTPEISITIYNDAESPTNTAYLSITVKFFGGSTTYFAHPQEGETADNMLSRVVRSFASPTIEVGK